MKYFLIALMMTPGMVQAKGSLPWIYNQQQCTREVRQVANQAARVALFLRQTGINSTEASRFALTSAMGFLGISDRHGVPAMGLYREYLNAMQRVTGFRIIINH